VINISNLNYLEVANEASKVHGGSLRQLVITRQRNDVRAGGGSGINIGNTALGLNLNIPTLTAIPVLSVFD
jgi:hypothetical protein